MKPTFATNRPADGERPTERVADAINTLLEHLLDLWNQPFELAIASGYFNPDGFNLLADALERVGEVRILLGAEPESPDRKVRHLDPDTPPQRAERARLRSALAGHVQGIEEDRDLLGFSLEADIRAKRLIQWLRSGRVRVRRLEKRFLHGKAFLVTTHREGVIAGSSNFTYAGLARNAELNLGHYQPEVVEQVQTWFEEQWEDAEQFDLAAIYEARHVAHNPYLIYLRMLYERYGAEIREEAEDAGLVGIHLTSFQKDGVWRAKKILRDYGGVVIADGVGLGKSFVGGELMREAVQDRRQRVLLVAPASLRDGPWRTFLEEYQLGIKVVSFEELSNDRQLNPAGGGDSLRFDYNDYAMVVIDEAHAYRNPDTQRAAVLRRLLSGSPAKDLILMTATPVNNSLWDLYYLLSYFIKDDAEFSDIGIKSLREHFAESMAESFDELSPERLFDILDAVAVRRTRHFVKRYYPHETIHAGGLEVPITFPEPHVRKVTYDLDEVLPGFFPHFAHALAYEDTESGPEQRESGPQLTLARYVPSRYLRRGGAETHELQLAGLLRSGLLKRFESSAHAFARTCRKMAESHSAFLWWLEQGYVVTGEGLAEWTATDHDTPDLFADLEVGDRIPKGASPAQEYNVASLRRDAEADRALLLQFAAAAERVTYDNDVKLQALKEQLKKIAREAREEAIGSEDERDKRKVILFSYYADTVEWIRGYLDRVCASEADLAPYRGRITIITGNEGDRVDALFGFAPVSSKAPPRPDQDRYDLLISTDVLAEGVNLQQARHIINYDLPWNPMRLVQRHGRIDRIGSKHDKVYLRCFFPDVHLDELLRLEERLHHKIAQAAASIGVENEVIPGAKVSEHTFAETRAEIERLRQEDPELFETGGETGTAFSGEEYRQELRDGLEHHDLEEQLKRLPWGSGSGKVVPGAVPGYVFCARVGDHPTPLFRYVAYANPAEPEIISDTLTCLAKAHAMPDTPRVLTEAAHRQAYDAWAIAREDIFERWDEATDLRSLQPIVPKAMRDAADLLREYPPMGMSQEERNFLLDALESQYPVRLQKMVRDAMRSSNDPRDQAVAVARTVRELGLEPPTPPAPLPIIDPEDVHLVCWMAIFPEQRQPGRAIEFGAPEQVSFAPGEQVYFGQ